MRSRRVAVFVGIGLFVVVIFGLRLFNLLPSWSRYSVFRDEVAEAAVILDRLGPDVAEQQTPDGVASLDAMSAVQSLLNVEQAALEAAMTTAAFTEAALPRRLRMATTTAPDVAELEAFEDHLVAFAGVVDRELAVLRVQLDGHYYDDALATITHLDSAGRLVRGRIVAGSTILEGLSSRFRRVEAAVEEANAIVSTLTPYEGPVAHIFFHPLIVDPERAFGAAAWESRYKEWRKSLFFHAWFATNDEFVATLDELRERNYVLVNVEDFVERSADGYRPKPLLLPPGVKPVVLSVDDLNYYEFTIDYGLPERMVLEDDGDIAVVVRDGNLRRTFDDEGFVPALEAYLERHPGFAYQDARAIIAITGYEGAFGYRITRSWYPDRDADIQAVTELASALRERGYVIASHSYGHMDKRSSGVDLISGDIARWEQRIGSVVGSTEYFIFPYGATPRFDSPNFRALVDSGFRFFFGVERSPNNQFTKQMFYMGRINIDGSRMGGAPASLAPFIDIADVWDPARESVLARMQ